MCQTCVILCCFFKFSDAKNFLRWVVVLESNVVDDWGVAWFCDGDWH